MCLQRLQVLFLFDLAGELDRQRTLGGLVVPGLVVDGEGKDRRVVGKGGSGAIAVVEIEIDDQDLSAEAIPSGPADGDGDVVEDTEAATGLRSGVMKATTEVDGDLLSS